MVNSIQALGVLISSMAVATESSFPNITIPDFEFHGSNCIDISKVLQVSFAPLVSEKYRPFWEAYSVAHHDWPKSTVDSGLGQLITDQLVNVSDGLIPPRIHPSANESQMKGKSKIEDDVFETWVYAPVWQQVPAPSDLSVINFDLLSHSVLARVFRQMSTIRKPVLSESFDMSFLSSGAVTDVLMVPISQSLVADEESDSVGVLVAVVAWDVYFVDILHGGSNGIIVVLDGPNDDHFTYKINGPEAIFLGTGDLHDSRYNDIEVSTPFAPFLADGQGLYILRMFPSWEMEQQYRTRKPFLFAAIVVLVFGCTAMVFLLFDYAVAIRQRKMITKAKRTHTIVSSLFPANVRDRMLQDADNNMQRKRELDDEKECAISNNSHVNQIFRRKSSDNIEMYDTKPIADLFPDATVMVRAK